LGRAARQRASRITASELRCNMGGGRAVARARGITTTDASARSVPPPRTAGPRRVSARRARAAGPAFEVGGKRRRRAVGPPRVTGYRLRRDDQRGPPAAARRTAPDPARRRREGEPRLRPRHLRVHGRQPPWLPRRIHERAGAPLWVRRSGGGRRGRPARRAARARSSPRRAGLTPGRRPGVEARAALLWVALVAACRAAPVEPCPAARLAADRAPLVASTSRFDSAFAAAGAEFHVPPTVLKGIGWVETRWQMVEGAEEFSGRPPAFGVMALRG